MKVQKSVVEQRRNLVLNILSKEPDITADALALRLHVSPITIRRDLQYWEEKNRITRFYGGAKITQTFLEAHSELSEIEIRKNAIAKRAAEFIEDGDTIFINTSTTALLILSHIKNKKINVITNNANAVFIQKDFNINVILTGGELREPKESMVGEFAINNLSRVSANKTFIGCSGISSKVGITTAVLAEVAINELMLKQCTGTRFVLADSTKIGHNHSFVSNTLSRVDILITDDMADEEECKAIEEKNVRILKV